MVEGIERFREAMADYADNYIIIGGTACDIILDGSPMSPRPTRDIDLIVVVEKLSREFVEAFWQFVREGGYEPAKRTSVCGEQVYALYRFVAPKQAGYPYMLELLSRHSELLGEPSGFHIEPIPDDEQHQSLSAIIMNEEVYQFTLAHSSLRGGLRVADTLALIALKATAYLNLLKAKEEGQQVNSDDIKKHRGDVLKLIATGDIAEPVVLPSAIYEVVDQFRELIMKQPEQSLASIVGSRDVLALVKDDLNRLFVRE